MPKGQASSEAPKEEAVASVTEANLAEEQEEHADGADDRLDSALEADDDVDLAFDEEVGFMRRVF